MSDNTLVSPTPMDVRDRIKELRRVPARQLRPNPKNWRTHPPAQQDALRGVLAEIGYAGALLARELEDGSLELIDGHLRAETTPDSVVPVLVLDVSAEEADKLLATFDPLGLMAGVDPQAVQRLLAGIETDSPAIEAMMRQLAAAREEAETAAASDTAAVREVEIPRVFQIVVECTEADQETVYDRLKADGLKCRVVTL